MLPENTVKWGKTRSCIRDLMEYGMARKAVIGPDNVFDFSIGNPSIPAPVQVKYAILELLEGDSVELHGYTTAAGLMSLRKKIAEDLCDRFEIDVNAKHMYITCGAAASLTITINALLNEGEEVIVVAPFFPEYRVFIEAAGGVCKVAQPAEDLTIDVEAVKRLITDKTRAIIVNSPNNPSGVVYPRQNFEALAEVLKDAETTLRRRIYLITDEPYRELVYNNLEVYCPFRVYDDSIMCYSFSKSMSMPGERLGYIAINEHMMNIDDVYASIMGSGRSLGYVNAPSMFQRVVERAYGNYADIDEYRTNRDLLCDGLEKLGYEFVKPDGAFYLFVKALEDDAKAFSEQAKKHELLIVPSDDFGIKGYVRLAYCVKREMIEKSMDAFKALMDDYKTSK